MDRSSEPTLRRISVVGTTGSGKTTMARTLGSILGLPVLELDEAHWGPDWTPRSDQAIRDRISEVIAGNAWVVDGNYSRFQGEVWDAADTVVWLDLSFRVVFGRLVARTFRRSVRRETLWAGNRETLRTALFSRDSILWWQLKTFRKNRIRYRARLANSRWAHLHAIHLRSTAAEKAFLRTLGPIGG